MKKILDLFTKPAAEQESPKKGEDKAEDKAEDKEGEVLLPERSPEKLKEDINELLSLFPKLKAEAVPEEVWDRVREGDSLCAAYCLWVVKSAKEQLHIREVNDKHSQTAPPPVANKQEEEFFTRETVKNMSPQEVRKHFKAILNSMDRWK